MGMWNIGDAAGISLSELLAGRVAVVALQVDQVGWRPAKVVYRVRVELELRAGKLVLRDTGRSDSLDLRACVGKALGAALVGLYNKIGGCSPGVVGATQQYQSIIADWLGERGLELTEEVVRRARAAVIASS